MSVRVAAQREACLSAASSDNCSGRSVTLATIIARRRSHATGRSAQLGSALPSGDAMQTTDDPSIAASPRLIISRCPAAPAAVAPPTAQQVRIAHARRACAARRDVHAASAAIPLPSIPSTWTLCNGVPRIFVRVGSAKTSAQMELIDFSVTVLNRWNSLPVPAVQVNSVNCFKNQLEKLRNNQMDF